MPDIAMLWWLSFVGDFGTRVAVVSVTATDMARLRDQVSARIRTIRRDLSVDEPVDEPAVQLLTALTVARERGCNPGGEVRGVPLRSDRPIPYPLHRLMTKAEAEAYERKAVPSTQPRIEETPDN